MSSHLDGEKPSHWPTIALRKITSKGQPWSEKRTVKSDAERKLNHLGMSANLMSLGGLVSSTALTLLLLPVVYAFFEGKKVHHPFETDKVQPQSLESS